MSSLMVDFISSLDGYASADGWPGYWGMEAPEYLGWITEEAKNDLGSLRPGELRRPNEWLGDVEE